ncbi:hypothetical protein PI87_21990 [Ralstonia sp. A12]|nr:hypothetical protein PI87_21990 [Ralstonia sp. A12]
MHVEVLPDMRMSLVVSGVWVLAVFLAFVFPRSAADIACADRPATASVYEQYKAPFLNTVAGAKSGEF